MLFKSEIVRLALLVVVLSSSLVLCAPAEKTPDTEEYDYSQDPENPEGIKSQDVPEFLSVNQSLNAVLGQPIVIGCQVNKLEGNQLMWSVKYDNDVTDNPPQILRVGTHLFANTPENIEIEDIVDNNDVEGSKLTVKNFSKNDAGKYICTIAIEKPKEVHFQVSMDNKGNEKEETRTDAATSAVGKTSQFSIVVVFLSTLLFAVINRK